MPVWVVVVFATRRIGPLIPTRAVSSSQDRGPAGSWGHERPIGWRCRRAQLTGAQAKGDGEHDQCFQVGRIFRSAVESQPGAARPAG
jgi:hypothetical protein